MMGSESAHMRFGGAQPQPFASTTPAPYALQGSYGSQRLVWVLMARYSVKLAVARLKQAGGLGGGAAPPPICKHNACTMSSESAHMGSVLDCTIVLTATPRPGAEHAREGSEKSFPCLLPIF